MKQMEYTIKVVTTGPIESAALTDALYGLNEEVRTVVTATVTNFRVLPNPKPAKVGA